jgi:hypothetical protein
LPPTRRTARFVIGCTLPAVKPLVDRSLSQRPPIAEILGPGQGFRSVRVKSMRKRGVS